MLRESLGSIALDSGFVKDDLDSVILHQEGVGLDELWMSLEPLLFYGSMIF